MKSIKVLILKGHPGGMRTWSNLGRFSKKSGSAYSLKVSTKIGSAFTYKDIRRISPDVIVLSDSAGTPVHISKEEFAAIEDYVTHNVGKSIIATYATFFYEDMHNGKCLTFDNRDLLPLFGMRKDSVFRRNAIKSQHISALTREGKYLLGDRTSVGGYQYSQEPEQGWENALCGSRLIALDPNNQTAVVFNEDRFYSSLYISSMPEYGDDEIEPDVGLVYRMVLLLYESSQRLLQTLCCQELMKTPTPSTILQSEYLPSVPHEIQRILLYGVVHRKRATKEDVAMLVRYGIPPQTAQLALARRSKQNLIRGQIIPTKSIDL